MTSAVARRFIEEPIDKDISRFASVFRRCFRTLQEINDVKPVREQGIANVRERTSHVVSYENFLLRGLRERARVVSKRMCRTSVVRRE